ncbi:MAG: DegT/DnrJ/EryC1/StrS family aminotransferase [Flavobacteriales bacterium]|nr:DegT/DnrJ/EryC1/StrS family aminotransferase [Flavobacteriales bacterium]
MKKIFVTKPSLPPKDQFYQLIDEIWESEYITNDGDFHKKLEKALSEYLEVDHISVFSNGTLALITALQALNIKGEVITTPYSFVATTNSLIWNGITPVFADIDEHSCNMSVDAVEKAITPQTTALMPVHVYGTPCDMEGMEALAKKHNLKIIYDAAHAFGVKYNGQSILNYGDLSILSFHATKVYNTIEGGAIISHSAEMKTKIDNLKNFGITDELTVVDSGINAKMNEVQAAYGLLNLKYIDENIRLRKEAHDYYASQLKDVPGLNLLDISSIENYNYGYFPVFVGENYPVNRDQLYDILMKAGIYSRRYFYPLISDFPIYASIPSANRSNLPHAVKLTESVLCLPLYAKLDRSTIDRIVDVVKNPEKR